MGDEVTYSKVKFHVTIDKDLYDELEKVKMYPKWKGNRSKVINEALEKMLREEIHG